MKYKKRPRIVDAKVCSQCQATFTMEGLGLDPNDATDRLKFSRKKTCGAEACVKKAVGKKPANKKRPSPSNMVKRSIIDDAQEVAQHVKSIIKDLYSNTPGFLTDVDPRIVMYRRMMGRAGYAA